MTLPERDPLNIRRGAYSFDISRLIGDINFSSDPVFKEVLIFILSKVNYITIPFVTEGNDVHAFGFNPGKDIKFSIQ